MTAAPGSQGFIESPRTGTEMEPGLMKVCGWAHSTQGVASVEVVIDGDPAGAAQIGNLREDAVRFLGDADALWAGFEHYVDVSEPSLRGRELSIGVRARLLDGSFFELPGVIARVRHEPRPAPTAGNLASLARRPAIGGPVRRRSDGRIGVLALGPSLDHGGASVCLRELLRSLSRQREFTGTVISPTDGPMRAGFESHGFPVQLIGALPFGSAELYELRVARLAELVHRSACDVVVGNTLLGFPAVDVAARLGIPAIWWLHETWEPPLFWQIFFGPEGLDPHVRGRWEEALRSASVAVFASEATRRAYTEYIGSARCETIPVGIAVEPVSESRSGSLRTAARTSLGIADDHTLLLCVGVMTPWKGQSLLVRAFERVARSHPGARLVLLGDSGSPYGSALQDWVTQRDLAGLIRFEPVTSDPSPWYRAADWLVVASDSEALPRSILEAMSFELPVLATDVGGIGELVEDDQTGYLCAPRDLRELSTALDRTLATTPAERRRLAVAGGRRVRAPHAPVPCAEAFADLLRGAARASEPH